MNNNQNAKVPINNNNKKRKYNVSTINLIKRRISKGSNLLDIPNNLNYIDDIKLEEMSRDRFSYNIISNIGWWPDEIYTFMNILKVAHSDIIISYMHDFNLFDDSLKKAIYFMTQKKYNKIIEISKFMKTGNFLIPDGYLNYIMKEDLNNFEISNKFEILIEALEKLLKMGRISEEDIILKKDTEILLRIFISIYRMIKSIYNINNKLIIILRAAIKFIRLDLNLINLIEEFLKELEEKVFIHFKYIHDQKLFNNICIYRDLLFFSLSQCLQFNFIFTYKHSLNIKSNKISPLYNNIFTEETLKRIHYTYLYYLNNIHSDHKEKLTKPIYFINTINNNTKNKNNIIDRSISEHFNIKNKIN